MRKLKITLMSLLLFIITVGIVYYYIDTKKKRLHAEFVSSLEHLFQGKDRIVDLVYEGTRVDYEEIDLPDRQSNKIRPSYKKTYIEDWDNYYGDIIRLYAFDSNLSNISNNGGSKNVWRIVIAERTKDGVDVRFIFPYGIGYIRQDTNFGYAFAPEVEDVLSSVLRYEIQNPMSDYSRGFEKGMFEGINKKLAELENRYYSIKHLSNYINELPSTTSDIWREDLLCGQEGSYSNSINTDHQIYSKYYRAYVGSTKNIHLKIREDSKQITIDLILLCWFWLVVVFSIFIIINVKCRRNR